MKNRQNNIKLLILGDVNSPHTIKWVNELFYNGITISIFSLIAEKKMLEYYPKDVKIHLFGTNEKLLDDTDSGFSKLTYLFAINKVKKIISEFKPDIIHAHYASSYGLIGALTNFSPFLVSAWGSDIYQFPNKSVLHKIVLKYILKHADRVLSTSIAMATEINKYSSKKIIVTPFGIDTEKFSPNLKKINDDEIVIGTIKKMEDNYGIKTIINAFKTLKNIYPSKQIKLLLGGGGPQLEEYKTLVKELNLENYVEFTGFISPVNIEKYHNKIDIFLNVSKSESFGVSILESSACAKPIIATDVGGIPEVVVDNETGFLIPVDDINNLVDKISTLINSKETREKMGENGREYVLKNFNMSKLAQKMIEIYKDII